MTKANGLKRVMNPEILEEKVELLKWIINLNDERIIKNLVNFKNEVLGVPFVEQPVAMQKVNYQFENGINDPGSSPDYLKFGNVSEGFSVQFEEALSLEEAKERSIKKISGWWRD